MDLLPGEGIGPFRLGSSVFQILSLIRSSRQQYPKCDVSWNDKYDADSPIVMQLQSPPLKLFFEGHTQTLTLMELLEPLHWADYKGVKLKMDPDTPSRRSLHRLFGPTSAPSKHPGYPNEMILCYPGIAFSLSSASEMEPLQRVIISSALEAPNPTRIFAESVQRPSQTKLVLKEALVTLSSGPLSLELTMSNSDKVEISLDVTTSEDLLCELGAADQRYWQEDDRLAIHAKSMQSSDVSSLNNPYFMNYFSLGIDFLLDSTDHRVRKVVLHTNICGESLFGRYERCYWSIQDTKESTKVKCTDSATDLANLVSNQNGKKDSSTERKKTKPERRTDSITLDRSADAHDDLLLGRTTELVVYEHFVVEVTQDDRVETLWLV